jgi:hypothetical protein
MAEDTATARPVMAIRKQRHACRLRQPSPFWSCLPLCPHQGDKYVGVASANIAQQCLNAGLLGEIRIELIPVLLGDGTRFFDNLKDTPVHVDGPRVIEGAGVTHLTYCVRRGGETS